MKKARKILTWIIVFSCLGFVFYKVRENIIKRELSTHAEYSENRSKLNTKKTLLIAHGGGALPLKNEKNFYGVTSNTSQALDYNYKKGVRYFEIDLLLTSDHKIIGRHDWEPYLYDILEQKAPNSNGEPLSYDQITKMKVHKNYDVLTSEKIKNFLKKHPDAHLILDTKLQSQVKYKDIMTQFVNDMGTDKHLLSQVIPQFYYMYEYRLLEQIYPYSQTIFTIYNNKENQNDIIQFIGSTSKLYAITVGKDKFSENKNLIDICHNNHKKFLMNTIDDSDEAQKYISEGVDGIYTNLMLPK